MAKPKLDNVGSIVRSREVITFGTENNKLTHVDHRWVCSCGIKGHWYNRAYPKTYLLKLWEGHLARKHPEYSQDLEIIGNETEGI